MLKLSPRSPYVTQCQTQLAIIDVHCTAMMSYLLILILITGAFYLIIYVLNLFNVPDGNIIGYCFTGKSIRFMNITWYLCYNKIYNVFHVLKYYDNTNSLYGFQSSHSTCSDKYFLCRLRTCFKIIHT